MLFAYPIDDGKFALQLYYLFPGTGTSAVCWSIAFAPLFFDQFPAEAIMANQPFRFDETTQLPFPVCNHALTLLEQLKNPGNGTAFSLLLHQSQLATRLLAKALECITIPFTVCQLPACGFLAHDSERLKIQEACQIIRLQEGKPLSIRELSRKVAMNECYLKKGFKILTGKTIHEYQQEVRISKAKELLARGGHSVTDVSIILGFSSIAHFSSAFKKFTGLKPCELLA